MAAVKVVIPAVMASSTRGEREVRVEGGTVQEVIDLLAERYGESFERRVLDSSGKVRSVLNLYLNGKNIRFLGNFETKLGDGDEVMLLPAVSGG